MKEKSIEQGIVSYLRTLGAIVETQNGGSIMIKKGGYNHKMTLQTKGCPDIICFYKGNFIGIEVKKDQKAVDDWVKKRLRYDAGEVLPKSYERELKQIEYMYKIMENGGSFILTCDIEEVVDYFINL